MVTLMQLEANVITGAVSNKKCTTDIALCEYFIMQLYSLTILFVRVS